MKRSRDRCYRHRYAPPVERSRSDGVMFFGCRESWSLIRRGASFSRCSSRIRLISSITAEVFKQVWTLCTSNSEATPSRCELEKGTIPSVPSGFGGSQRSAIIEWEQTDLSVPSSQSFKRSGWFGASSAALVANCSRNPRRKGQAGCASTGPGEPGGMGFVPAELSSERLEDFRSRAGCHDVASRYR